MFKIREKLYQIGLRPKPTSIWYDGSLNLIYKSWFHGRKK